MKVIQKLTFLRRVYKLEEEEEEEEGMTALKVCG